MAGRVSEQCVICKGDQDTRTYPKYNICTECADLMEDLMSEYFIRTIRFEGSKNRTGYHNYLENSKQYISDYKRIRNQTKRHIKHMGEHVKGELESGTNGSRQRYLERILNTLNWLDSSPEFYNYYFREYYVCPNCGSSIFDHYQKQDVGDWLMITCDNCDTVIKKYFSPKFVS